MVIRQTQAERCNAGALKHAAELNLSIPFAIPLRQNDHREVFAGVEKSAEHRVVFRIRGLDRAWKLQDLAIENVFGGGFRCKKSGAILQCAFDIIVQYLLRVSVGVNSEVFRSPLESQRFAIIVSD